MITGILKDTHEVWGGKYSHFFFSSHANFLAQFVYKHLHKDADTCRLLKTTRTLTDDAVHSSGNHSQNQHIQI